MKLPFDVEKEVLEAEERIRPHIRTTPLEHSLFLSEATEGNVYLKLENLQYSGSFKLRGAMNKYLSMSEADKKRGVMTSSSGNHGAAYSFVLRKFNDHGTIYLPKTVPDAKLEALKLYGMELRIFGDDCILAEMEAKRVAETQDQVFMSPYNDPQIIGGQGTIGVELERQLSQFDTVIVPVGGGGLISGIAGYLKTRNPSCEIIGVQPWNSKVMYESVKAGKILDLESLPTISDATAGGIEPGSITFDICMACVDDFILLSEEEIEDAIRLIMEKHFLLIEGGAALTVAALMKDKRRFTGKKVVLVFSGAKISMDALSKIICDKEGR